MAKRKDIEFRPAKELENELNQGESPKGSSKFHQELGKGEKGRSQSQSLGKNVVTQERKKK
jgi:hypothetical protein